jgi:DNA-directed RNA polymerase subunit beta
VAIPKATVRGKVEKITDTEIVIDGKSHSMYNNFSLNAESFLNNEPIVKVGDIVKEDDIIADNNFTRDGQVARGANLKIAYLPYKGYNYEDSAVVSESAAKKLTSMHM